jgi:hypothetical protein
VALSKKSEAGGPLRKELAALGQIVLVLQGGGALGAYQAGVYQALHDAGIEPDWVIGTSIGAINAALIAGNAPDARLEALRQFWQRVENDQIFGRPSGPWFNPLRTLNTMMAGIPNFFSPRPFAFANPHLPLGPDNASYYSTEALRHTLLDLVDFDRLGAQANLPVQRSTLIIFGNPPLGIQFLQSSPYAGLDWPVRMLVFEDAEHRVWVSWTSFDTIAARYGITDRTAQIQMAGSVAASIAAAAAGK